MNEVPGRMGPSGLGDFFLSRNSYLQTPWASQGKWPVEVVGVITISVSHHFLVLYL